ncbi:pentapeptide repeat-containing protein [Synechococcus sp. UW140]|uniref:pentapeptide repeat-containing protein n=1 Tax=Synechococcus sp. UW140 TaxID=368503 RepID=UPI000E0FEBDE|nr:pentapeptide repeat-containing protein [Synechococcus sp. UW140]
MVAFFCGLAARLKHTRAIAAGLLTALVCLAGTLLSSGAEPALAITAPELRGQFAVQEISADMHGLDLKEKEFLKADLQGVDLSDSDLRGAVINTSMLQGADLQRADLGDVVAFASRFDGADLRDARFENAMMMQSRFTDARIDGADFSNAVIDLSQQKALCARADGVNSVTSISTRESLGCR